MLEALESEGEWVTNRVRPGKIILDRLGEIEAGVRQMIRARPLVAREITDAIARSGMSRAELAGRLGTSASRLST